MAALESQLGGLSGGEAAMVLWALSETRCVALKCVLALVM